MVVETEWDKYTVHFAAVQVKGEGEVLSLLGPGLSAPKSNESVRAVMEKVGSMR